MGSNLAIKPGSEVGYDERRLAIMQVISFEAVVARDVETNELERPCRSSARLSRNRTRRSRFRLYADRSGMAWNALVRT